MGEKIDSTSNIKLSERFCQSDADVAFVSSDRVMFKIHLKNLETSTGGFPPSEFKSGVEETTELLEDSETLEILFAFIYPSRHPKLDDLSTDLLLKLAEAAEKYEVYAAMNICYERVKTVTKEEPLKVLVFAFKHDYPSLLNEAASLLHDIPVPELIRQLPQALIVPWVSYHEEWRNSIVDAFNDLRVDHTFDPNPQRCGECDEELAKAMNELFSARPLKLSKESIRKFVHDSLKKGKHLTAEFTANFTADALISNLVEFTPYGLSTFL